MVYSSHVPPPPVELFLNELSYHRPHRIWTLSNENLVVKRITSVPYSMFGPPDVEDGHVNCTPSALDASI